MEYILDESMRACSIGDAKAIMERKEVTTMKELRFTVENQPGALAKIASALGEARVNIDGITGLGSEDTGVICLAIDDPGAARKILQDLAVDFKENQALVIDISNHPGELATLLRRLADDGINVQSLYAGVERNKLILTVDNIARAKEILRIA